MKMFFGILSAMFISSAAMADNLNQEPDAIDWTNLVQMFCFSDGSSVTLRRAPDDIFLLSIAQADGELAHLIYREQPVELEIQEIDPPGALFLNENGDTLLQGFPTGRRAAFFHMQDGERKRVVVENCEYEIASVQ